MDRERGRVLGQSLGGGVRVSVHGVIRDARADPCGARLVRAHGFDVGGVTGRARAVPHRGAGKPDAAPRQVNETGGFLQGLARFGASRWMHIAFVLRTRSAEQVRSHAQKYFLRMSAGGSESDYQFAPEDDEEEEEEAAATVAVADSAEANAEPQVEVRAQDGGRDERERGAAGAGTPVRGEVGAESGGREGEGAAARAAPASPVTSPGAVAV